MSILPILHKLAAPLLSQLARLSPTTRLTAVGVVALLLGIALGSRWLPTCPQPAVSAVVSPVLRAYARHNEDTTRLQTGIAQLQQQAAQQPATDCLGDHSSLINQARQLTTGDAP